MTDNVLIPLPGFELPADLPWRSGFVSLINDQLRRLRSTGHFLPPRFFGYHFIHTVPVGVAGSWTVSLDAIKPMSLIPDMLEKITHGEYSITTSDSHRVPDFLLIHDRKDGACWLWTYKDGLNFVEAHDPIIESDDKEDSRLSDPGKGV